MRRKRLLRLGNTGDTIIEVLLAIAIVGVVMAGAFTSVNRSLRGTIVSKDRVEAVNYARGQLEILMAWLDDPTKKTNVTSRSDMCFNIASAGPNPITIASGGCVVGRYTLNINRVTDSYTVSATWEKATSTDTEKVEIKYKADRS